MVGHLVLVQRIGVRIPVSEPRKMAVPSRGAPHQHRRVESHLH